MTFSIRAAALSFLSMVAASFILLAPASAAVGCDTARYDHNGSGMEVHVCDGRMVIEYDNPKASLARLGVVPGTILFEGVVYEMTGGSKISGQARVFKRNCQPAFYEVNGWMQYNENGFALEGTAPVRTATCRVGRTRQDILRFRGM